MSTLSAAQGPAPSPTSSPSTLIDPVPLSMPSILVNPRSSNSASHTLANRAIKPPPSASSSSSSHRHIGRRKLLRRINSAPSSHNPHAVARPRAADYLPSHSGQERYRGTFPSPTPRYLREVGKQGEIRDARQARDLRVEWEQGQEAAQQGRRELRPGDKGLDDARSDLPPDSGLFTMSIQEARFFLHRRAGVTISRSGRPHQRSNEEASPPPLPEQTPMQHLVDCLEREFQDWADQFVYLPTTSTAVGGSLTSQPTILVEASDDGTASTASRARVEEHQRLPQSLVLCVPNAFDRLAVHCLARVWGMRSFSKPAPNSGEEGTKLTWILKPPPSKTTMQKMREEHRQRQREGGAPFGSLSAPNPAGAMPVGIVSRSQGGLETPPTTDVGTSASELGDSSDDDDGWSVSEADAANETAGSATLQPSEGDATLDIVAEEEGDEEDVSVRRTTSQLATVTIADEHDGYAGSGESAPGTDDEAYDYAADDDDGSAPASPRLHAG